jgi:hypothetical protein
MKLSFMRAVLGALALGTLAACETRQLTEGGADDSNPVVTLSTPGQDPDSIDVSSPLQVLISAGDNLSLLEVAVAVSTGGAPVTEFDTTFRSATPVFSRVVTIPLANATAGQQITLTALARDGANNFSTHTLTITVYDPTAPTVQITGPAANTVYRAGAPFNVGVRASDIAGVSILGFQLIQMTATGQVTVFSSQTHTFDPAVVDAVRTFPAVVPDTLLPGAYLLRGTATDLTGNAAFSAPVQIQVQDGVKPGMDLLSPPADSSITLGSDIIAVAHLTDNVGIARFSVVGISTRGDPDLGVVDTITRFDSVYAPVNVAGRPQSFRPGLRDTTVRRLLIPTNRADTVTEAVFLIARVTDIAGNDSVIIRRVQLVSGPAIRILRPGNGAIAAPGKSVVIELRAADEDGVRSIGYHITSATFDTTVSGPSPTSPPDTLVFVDTITVPAAFPPNSSFTITPFGTDNVGQPGAGPSVVVTVLAPGADIQGPLVYQTLDPRIESDDSVQVRAIDPSGIAEIGYIMTSEATGVEIQRLSVAVGTEYTDAQVMLPMTVPVGFVGQKIVIRSFAIDASGNTGYSVPNSTSTPETSVTQAKPDTALVVYGRTFSLPNGGLAADIAVDTMRGVAFLSNLTFDRVEMWQSASAAFASKTIAVGSDPWGMVIDNSRDTLLVANSGGTNISRVFIGSADPALVGEVASRRIKTPNTQIFDVTVTVSNATVRYKIVVHDYSDRPQFVAQSITDEIYYSTKPTTSAIDGTLRHYDPNFPSPDVRMVWQYGSRGGQDNIAVINADSVFAKVSLLQSASDSIVVCDHPYGSTAPSLCFQSDLLSSALAAAQAYGADVVGVSNLEVASLGLTDTTFVATGGDRRWIAFGEGNSPGVGRVMMAQDPGDFFSPGTSVRDLTNNAAERVFGIAINRNSTGVASHGLESYFSEIDAPFHLRLQGKFNTFDAGAGIAYHPNNVGDGSLVDERVAFVASADGTIDIVDSFHYTGRGKLPVRANLYGPIRVTNRFPGDDPAVILKLFGLTTEGLIVIDIRATDIKPLP